MRRRAKLSLWGRVLLGVGLLSVAGGILVLTSSFRMDGIFNWSPQRKDFLTLWQRGEYDAILVKGERFLEKHPLDATALFFVGISHFYKAISRLSVEERLLYLDRAIFSLRNVKNLAPEFRKGEVSYVLGKAYLEKGYYFADLAVHYLTESLTERYHNEDSYIYLARGYQLLRQYEKSLSFYKKAAWQRPTGALYLAIAGNSEELGNREEAQRYYQLSVEVASDQAILEKGLFHLGKIHYDSEDYAAAKEVLERLEDLISEGEEVYFLLGETYWALGERAKAREQWIKVVRTNPRHSEALNRLYG